MNQPIVRVVDLETTGSHPPAHGVCEVGWQDVARLADGSWVVDETRGTLLINPGRTIPAVTMAVHHIVDADVADAPLWAEIAPTMLQPERGIAALAAHSAAFEQRFCGAYVTGDTPWVCTWKCALRLFPDSPRFSNQVLRYWRMPVGLDRDMGLPVHRALPDAYVTAHHLRDMLNLVALEQLVAWSRLPGLLPRVPAGPHRGQSWSELDADVLARFLDDRNEDVRFTAQCELDRRSGHVEPAVDAPRQGRLL